jgi:cephalosporin-C deacetylase-like acetyl esterase
LVIVLRKGKLCNATRNGGDANRQDFLHECSFETANHVTIRQLHQRTCEFARSQAIGAIMICKGFAVLLSTAATITSVLVPPQDANVELRVLADGVGPAEPSKMSYEFLLGEAQKLFAERRSAVAAINSAEELVQRQRMLKAKFVESLGGFPDKTPLNPRIVGKLSGDGFRVEKIVYESRPDHHVTAALYVPDGKPPVPGVLVPCGHSGNGKANEPYQRICILLAKNGIAALCYDPIGQGERYQLLDDAGKPIVPGSTTEHSLVGVGALLVGRQAASYRIWDGIRSLDYLASRPDIDPTRLGCTGNSGGGTLTAYLMALDERIVAAAPSCYITSLERLFATIGPQDAEQNITGQVAFGMEHADYVTMRAPRPTLLCVGTQDYFDITGAWATFREAKLAYGLLGHGERVDLFEFNDKHGFSKPRREAAMRWMRRWLLGKDDAPVEHDFPIFTDEELQCTKSGQVLAEFGGKSAFDLNADRDTELAAIRAKRVVAGDRPLTHETLRQQLGLSDLSPTATRRDVGIKKQDGYSITRTTFETEPGIIVPGLFFSPHESSTDHSVIYLNGDGMATETGPGGAIEKLCKSGTPVIALDLRGIGETAPSNPSATGKNYFGVDGKEAFLSLHINRPLLGQRVLDVLAVLNALRDNNSRAYHITAIGSTGPIALHAAALDDRIKQVDVHQSIGSWSAVVHTPISLNQLANAIPGALEWYDLPDLTAFIAPRRVNIVNPLDPREVNRDR